MHVQRTSPATRSQEMTDFGREDARQMPATSSRARCASFTTVPCGRSQLQNCSSVRYWYVDTVFACERCAGAFEFSGQEQRVWYEGTGSGSTRC
jgi:hypothetical protein